MKVQNTQYGIWDLAGSQEFQELWNVFSKFVPFDATIFIVRWHHNDKKNTEGLALSRKCLNYIAYNPHFKGKLLFLIINIMEENMDAKGNEEERSKLRDDLWKDALKILHWDTIPEPKGSYYLDAANYMHYEAVLSKFHSLHQQSIKNEWLHIIEICITSWLYFYDSLISLII